MDFAKKLMEKYGWKEGNGLGKNNDGRVVPIKASLKFDSSGLGCDKAKEFNNHWWERVFNEAAGNVEVENTDGNIDLKVKDEDSVEITTKEYSVRKLKKIRGNEGYENFLKHSTLTNTGNEEEIEGTIHDEDIKIKTKVVHLTDEELLAACGGRTAHKGARHGHTMKSKISRLEAQEQALLEQMLKSKKDLEEKDRNGFIKKKEKSFTEEMIVEDEPRKKKKKSKKCDLEESLDQTKEMEEHVKENRESEESLEKVPKKKKKSKASESVIEESEEPLKKKKKKSKSCDQDIIDENNVSESGTKSKSKKKSKRNKEMES
ncbi:GPATCH4 family protein [Megaselia abdita]